MEHEIACIVTNDFFYIQLKKKLQSLIGYKLKNVCIQKGIPILHEKWSSTIGVTTLSDR